jgi:hypothetical protein
MGRSNEDKRKAVMVLLDDPEWSQWSDREIGQRAGVSAPFVGSLRPSLETVTSEKSARCYMTKHGTQTTMHTENIGRSVSARHRYMPRAKRVTEITTLAAAGNRASAGQLSRGVFGYVAAL